MSDLKTQRNVAIGVAVVAVAFVGGYLFSGGRDRGTEPAAPAAVNTPVATAPAYPSPDPEPVADPAAPAASTPRATAASASRRAVPVAGERQRVAPAPSAAPVEEESRSAADAPASVPAFSAPAERAAAEPPQRRMVPALVPKSTKIVLDLVDGVSSQTAQVGDAVVAELAEPIRVDGRVVVAAGTRVTGQVVEAQALKKVGGKSILALSFDRLESGDGGAAIAAGFRREGKSETGKDAATIAAGAAIGTILGNQAKHNDRGKLIGAVVGAAAGTAVASQTKGETVELPAGARLELTLQDDVEVMIER